jgi:hypothetical protein
MERNQSSGNSITRQCHFKVIDIIDINIGRLITHIDYNYVQQVQVRSFIFFKKNTVIHFPPQDWNDWEHIAIFAFQCCFAVSFGYKVLGPLGCAFLSKI